MPNPRPDTVLMATLKAAFPPETLVGYLAIIDYSGSALTSTSSLGDWVFNYEVGLIFGRYSYTTPAAGGYTINTTTSPRQAEFTGSMTLNRAGSGPGSDFTFTDVLLIGGGNSSFGDDTGEIIAHWRLAGVAPADASTTINLPIAVKAANP